MGLAQRQEPFSHFFPQQTLRKEEEAPGAFVSGLTLSSS